MINQDHEKLEIVFKLDTQLDREEELGGSKLQKILIGNNIDDARVLQILLDRLERLGFGDISENGVKISSTAYLSKVKRIGKWRRSITAGGLNFRFGHATSCAHSFLSIEEISVGAGRPWDDWVANFLPAKEFVQAWTSNVDYDRWQNATDPLQYEAAGRSYDDLPMKSNELPPPLEQMEIDISANPARHILRPGYVEAIGSTMWLGPLFWEHVGSDRKDILLSDSRFTVQSFPAGIIKLIVSDSCFRDYSTKDIQSSLREILFGSTAK